MGMAGASALAGN
jgi:hypothetical protein